jgi:hypothetical protein
MLLCDGWKATGGPALSGYGGGCSGTGCGRLVLLLLLKAMAGESCCC